MGIKVSKRILAQEQVFLFIPGTELHRSLFPRALFLFYNVTILNL